MLSGSFSRLPQNETSKVCILYNSHISSGNSLIG
ncbi:hypothetical protein OIU76_027656, partial [Salix suchowensis]